MLILKYDYPFLYEFPILFSAVKLKLGYRYSQFIHRFEFGFSNVGLGLCILPSFYKYMKEMKYRDF